MHAQVPEAPDLVLEAREDELLVEEDDLRRARIHIAAVCDGVPEAPEGPVESLLAGGIEVSVGPRLLALHGCSSAVRREREPQSRSGLNNPSSGCGAGDPCGRAPAALDSWLTRRYRLLNVSDRVRAFPVQRERGRRILPRVV